MTEAMKRGQQIHEEIQEYILEHANRFVFKECVWSPPPIETFACADDELLQAWDDAR